MTRKAKVAILISGRGSNMKALIKAAKAPTYPAEIALVLSNKKEALGLITAKDNGIATHIIASKEFKGNREAFEQEMHKTLEAHAIDYVCLAGFMRLLTPWFVKQWYDRLINIHPSLLPSFKGLNTHKRALEAGVKFHGATVHFVREDMDTGPIIEQACVPVLEADTEESLARRVLEQEHVIYPKALKKILRN